MQSGFSLPRSRSNRQSSSRLQIVKYDNIIIRICHFPALKHMQNTELQTSLNMTFPLPQRVYLIGAGVIAGPPRGACNRWPRFPLGNGTSAICVQALARLQSEFPALASHADAGESALRSASPDDIVIIAHHRQLRQTGGASAFDRAASLCESRFFSTPRNGMK